MNDLRYAFCHVLPKTAKHNEVLILDDLPSLESYNWCRDFFLKQVFGDLRLKFNNDLFLQVNVSEEIGNSLNMLIDKATAILCSRSKIYDWPHTRARFLMICKDGPINACTVCSQLYFKEILTQLTQKMWSDYNTVAKKTNSTLPSETNGPYICSSCNSYLKKKTVP